MKQLLGNKKKSCFLLTTWIQRLMISQKKDKNKSFKSRSLLDEKQELFQLKCFV